MGDGVLLHKIFGRLIQGFACVEECGLDLGIMGGLEVREPVSEHPAVFRVHGMLFDHFEDEFWRGFSVDLCLVRGFRCDADSREQV